MVKYKSFTLIELLIVIVIISILSVSLIPKLKGLQDKAKYTRVQKDFHDIKTAVFMAQSNTGKPLKDITLSNCSYCSCATWSGSTYVFDYNLKGLGGSHPCTIRWATSLNNIALAAGMASGSLSSLLYDPRGSPYLLNENEGEGYYATPCTASDDLLTAGPDGFQGGPDSRHTKIAPASCPTSY